jgi:hypothetical protein
VAVGVNGVATGDREGDVLGDLDREGGRVSQARRGLIALVSGLGEVQRWSLGCVGCVFWRRRG